MLFVWRLAIVIASIAIVVRLAIKFWCVWWSLRVVAVLTTTCVFFLSFFVAQRTRVRRRHGLQRRRHDSRPQDAHFVSTIHARTLVWRLVLFATRPDSERRSAEFRGAPYVTRIPPTLNLALAGTRHSLCCSLSLLLSCATGAAFRGKSVRASRWIACKVCVCEITKLARVFRRTQRARVRLRGAIVNGAQLHSSIHSELCTGADGLRR